MTFYHCSTRGFPPLTAGGLAARKMLGRIHLKMNGSWMYTYPSAIDLTMHMSEVDGTCHRYLAVAYGKKKHGALRMVRRGFTLVCDRFISYGSLLSIVTPGEGRVAILRLREPGKAACVTTNGIATLLSAVLGVDATAGEP